MMLKKNNLTLIVSCSIAAVIVIIEIVLLFRFSGQYSEIRQDLKSAESELKTLMRRDPFPSEDNVEVERQNLGKLESQLGDIREWMRENQIQYHEWTTPTEFQIKLDPNLQELRSLADEKGVDLPVDFHFSFKKYAEGQMPAAANVPRLSRQLQMIKAISQILFENKIDVLQLVERTEFDAGDGSPSEGTAPSFSGRRSSGGRRSDAEPSKDRKDSRRERMDEEGMYAWEDFDIDFSTREQALWEILKVLAHTNLLVSVEDVDIASATDAIENIKEPDAARPAREGRTAPAFDPEGLGALPRDMRGARGPAGEGVEAEAAGGEEMPREDRVIAGDQPVNVAMKVRMYRFLDDNDQEKGERVQ